MSIGASCAGAAAGACAGGAAGEHAAANNATATDQHSRVIRVDRIRVSGRIDGIPSNRGRMESVEQSMCPSMPQGADSGAVRCKESASGFSLSGRSATCRRRSTAVTVVTANAFCAPRMHVPVHGPFAVQRMVRCVISPFACLRAPPCSRLRTLDTCCGLALSPVIHLSHPMRTCRPRITTRQPF